MPTLKQASDSTMPILSRYQKNWSGPNKTKKKQKKLPADAENRTTQPISKLFDRVKPPLCDVHNDPTPLRRNSFGYFFKSNCVRVLSTYSLYSSLVNVAHATALDARPRLNHILLVITDRPRFRWWLVALARAASRTIIAHRG